MSNVEMAIGPDSGKVIVKFKAPVDLVEFEPDNAIAVAEAMTKAAFESRDGVKPVGDALKAEIVERHRKTLYRRLEIVLNSKREDRLFTNQQLARELVDICLKEVF